ncbi:MAG TPA: cache domain-containing protein, partial [Clostridiaceae bacterium]
MLKKKELKRTRIFRGFLLSYILILILPYAFGSFVYFKALGIIEKDTKDARIFMLKQSSTIIDNYLKDLDRTVVSMSLNPNLKTLMYMNQPGYGSTDVYYLRLTQKELKTFNSSSTFRSDFYIFLKQGDLVLTSADVNFGIKDYYVNNFKDYNLSYEIWNQKILNSIHNREINSENTLVYKGNSDQKPRYLTYVQSLPLESPQKNQGSIVFLINAGDIDKLLMGVDESKTGYTYILDKNGKMVTGVSNNNNSFPDISIERNSSTGFTFKKIDGIDMAVIYIKSSYNNWTYVTALPTKVFMDKAIYIKKIIVTIVIITLLLGVCISIYLTRRNIRPIQETMLTLRKFFKGELGNGKNEYDFLKNGVAKLVNTHDEMK